jgi:hypothetical protein
MSILEEKWTHKIYWMTYPENNLFGMVMSREWTQRNYQKSWFTWNLKEGKNEAIPREPGKMEYIQP